MSSTISLNENKEPASISNSTIQLISNTDSNNNNNNSYNNNDNRDDNNNKIIKSCSDGILERKTANARNLSPQSLEEVEERSGEREGEERSGEREGERVTWSSVVKDGRKSNKNNNPSDNTDNNTDRIVNDPFQYTYTLPASIGSDAVAYNEMMSRLVLLQNNFLNSLTSIMEEFVHLSKDEMSKVLTPMAATFNSLRHTGQGVVSHLEKKWGIIDLGSHDHVFFDLSILLGDVEDLRGHFTLCEKLSFEAVKALKPSRANWKAVSVWRVSRRNSFHTNSSVPKPLPSARSSIQLTTKNPLSSTLSTSTGKLATKREKGSSEWSPVLDNWRNRRRTLNELPMANPFRGNNRSERSSFSKTHILSSNNSSNNREPTTFGVPNSRASSFNKPNPPPFTHTLHLPCRPHFPGISNKIRLSPCTTMQPPKHLYTMDSGVSVVEEYNSKQLLKKQQKQEEEEKEEEEEEEEKKEKKQQVEEQEKQIENKLYQLQQQRKALTFTVKEEDVNGRCEKCGRCEDVGKNADGERMKSGGEGGLITNDDAGAKN